MNYTNNVFDRVPACFNVARFNKIRICPSACVHGKGSLRTRAEKKDNKVDARRKVTTHELFREPAVVVTIELSIIQFPFIRDA